VPGPLALVGSGEYTMAMLDVERDLIAGRPPRYVQIPTAAGREGQARLNYWVELGRAQAERIGVEAVPLVVINRGQADDPAIAGQVDGAGLVYLSGGSPAFLADTLRGTALWTAIRTAWEGGAALAGCSAGAMALADRVPDLFRRSGGEREGLNLLPQLRILPHFDAMLGRVPDLLTRPFLRAPAGVSLVGVDENTALVGGPEEFTVRGVGSAWILGEGRRRQIPAGTSVRFPAPLE
jgi:cyanophycinase